MLVSFCNFVFFRKQKTYRHLKRSMCVRNIEIIDIECVLGNLAGTQIEKKIALINPPCWICPRSGLCELQWGEFNLPL